MLENRKSYCPDIAEYKDFVVREIEGNVFDVRFKTKEHDIITDSYQGEPDIIVRPWLNQIYRITFKEDDEFNLKQIKGSMPCLLK
ncbi:hypothetical protein [Psychroserpens jangbogonensis]|uniref:hypothetical protein n=1 Tax=Psychroserpens jangbogonensis TaxID=1484460 RepID=UPI00053DDB4B|nr:hypothetical protein [Psychroserpens jangbogonensis]